MRANVGASITSSKGDHMTRHWVATAVAGLIVGFSLVARPATGQGAATGSKTAPSKAAAITATRTPWGDPDLQGTWTTDSAFGIPLQRPAQFAGRAELND